MERFPALALVLRHGRAGSAVLAALIAIAIALLAWPSLGWVAPIVAATIGAVALLACRCFVELVQIITEMLVPQ